MAERVKLTFQKSERGEFVTIRKDGGFTVEDVTRLTRTVEQLFHDGADRDEDLELEAGESDENLGMSRAYEGGEEGEEPEEGQREGAKRGGGGENEAFLEKVQEAAKKAAAERGRHREGDGGQDGDKGPLGDTTPPAGRGQVAAKTPEGIGFKQSGEVDRRTLRGTPEHPDKNQQKIVKKVEQKVAGRNGGGEARQ